MTLKPVVYHCQKKTTLEKLKLFPLYYILKSNISMTAAISPNESAKYSRKNMWWKY